MHTCPDLRAYCLPQQSRMSEGRSCEGAFRSTDQHSLESFHKAMPLSQSPLLLPPAHSMLHVQQAIAMNLGQVSDMALPG